jgi:hypothetical protein
MGKLADGASNNGPRPKSLAPVRIERRAFLVGLTGVAVGLMTDGCVQPRKTTRRASKKFSRNRKSNPDLIDAPTRYGYQLRKQAGREPTAAQKKANNDYLAKYRKKLSSK